MPRLIPKPLSKLVSFESKTKSTTSSTIVKTEMDVDDNPGPFVTRRFDDSTDEGTYYRTNLLELENNAPISGPSSEKESFAESNFCCGQCGSFFANKATLQHHINSKHLKIKFGCEICNDFETSSAIALKKHKADVHGKFNSILSCKKCNYKSTKASKLKEHILNIHEGARYPCVQCSYVANSLGNLHSHKQSQHEHIKYPCDQCDHKSTRKQYLRIHKEKVHKVDK